MDGQMAYSQHPAAVCQRAWREANRERHRELRREWDAANPEKARETRRRWANKNKINLRVHHVNRDAKRRGVDGWLKPDQIKELKARQKDRCAVCRCDVVADWQIDHIMPLSLGGSNHIKNIQILCPSCNMNKGAKHPVDFMRSRGFLL